jgi:phenylalanine-4-hydroxylase
VHTDERGKVLFLRLSDCSAADAGSARLPVASGDLDLVVAEAPQTAHAGASDPEFWPASEFSSDTVPSRRDFSERERELLELYERALEAFRKGVGSQAVPIFEGIYRRIEQEFPDEWLLRWNLLESMLKLDVAAGLCDRLKGDLMDLEVRYAHQQPIASGLRYLGLLAS